MDGKECVPNKEGNNKRIEDGFHYVVRALDSLESLLQEIETGSKNADGGEKLVSQPRSISELINETPTQLKGIAERIRTLSNKLRDLIL